MYALWPSVPLTRSRPLLTHASAGDSWALMGKSGSVSFGVTAPFSWVLVHKVLFVLSKSLFSQSCVSSGGSIVVNGDLLQEGLCYTQVYCTRAPAPAAVHS